MYSFHRFLFILISVLYASKLSSWIKGYSITIPIVGIPCSSALWLEFLSASSYLWEVILGKNFCWPSLECVPFCHQGMGLISSDQRMITSLIKDCSLYKHLTMWTSYLLQRSTKKCHYISLYNKIRCCLSIFVLTEEKYLSRL